MIKRLLLLNGLAVVGAVVNHASGWGFTSLFWWTDRYQAVAVPDFSQLGGPAYYSLRAMEQLIMFSLPAFLFVSGFCVAFPAGRDGLVYSWSKASSRIKALLIPYVLWSIAIFVVRGLEGTTDTPGGYVGQLLFGRAAEPYYFVPLIIQMYLLAPLFVGVLKKHWKPVLLTAGLIQLVVQAARYPIYLGWDVPAATWILNHAPGWFFPNAIFWFVFGMVFVLEQSTLKQWLSQRKAVLPWITAALGVLAFVEWELLLRFAGRWLVPTPTVLDSLYAGSFILTFVAFAESRVPAKQPLSALGERSFGIYLMHAPVLELLSRVSYHAIPLLLAYQFVFQPLLIIVGVGIPILIMAAVNRSPARPYYNYLFG